MRLDCYLFEVGLAQSRQKAQECIARGGVLVNGVRVCKNSHPIQEDDAVCLEGHRQWVARSGEKLWGFLQESEICVRGKEVLDIGSSKGGFSEVLLSLGASKVVCVDVGSDQLDARLRADERIVLFENQDIRDFTHPPFELVVCDVSFISLTLILPKIYELGSAECILLFKPQFEVGRGVRRDKRGVIVDPERVRESLEEFLAFAEALGFCLRSWRESRLRGKEGNQEFFIHLCKPDSVGGQGHGI